MNTLLRIALVSVAVLGLGGFVGWRCYVAAHSIIPVEGLVFDPSSSHIRTKEAACQDLASVSAAIVAGAQDRQTRFTVLELGSSATAGEPMLLTDVDSPPTRTKLATGRRELKQSRINYLKAIYRKYMDAPAPEYSAIYRAVERMLESLRSSNCGRSAVCTVWVSTDGIENVQTSLQQRIRSHRTNAVPVAALNNDNIDIRFCGLAQTSGAPQPRELNHQKAFHSRPDPVALETAWRDVFTNPGHVTFQPFCPHSPPESQEVLTATAQ